MCYEFLGSREEKLYFAYRFHVYIYISARVQPHYDCVCTTYVDVPSTVRAHDEQVAELSFLPIPEIIAEIIVWLAGERLGSRIGCRSRGK